MKIAFVYDVAYPFVKGGGEKRIYEIARRLAKKHEVDWITLKWWDGRKNIEIDGIRYIGVGEFKKLYTKSGRRSINEAIYFGIKALPALLNDKYDVIDCTAFPYFPCFSARLYSALNRSKFFITWHEVWSDYWYEYLSIAGFFGKIIEKQVAKLGATHIAVSEPTRKELKKIGAGNIVVVPNGIDLKHICSIERSNENWDIVYAGRLIKEKGVDILIKAVAELRKRGIKAKTLIIGDGPEKKNLEVLAERLGVKSMIKFSSFVDSNYFYSLLKSAKVFVLPSRREGFGITALEAMACGTPVVTLDYPMNATSWLVNSVGNGYIVNVNELAEAIFKILQEPFRADASKLKNFDWNYISTKIEEIYSSSENS